MGRPKGSKNKKVLSVVKQRAMANAVPGQKKRGRKSRDEMMTTLYKDAKFEILREPMNFVLQRSSGGSRVSYFSSLDGVFTAMMNETVGEGENKGIPELLKAVGEFKTYAAGVAAAIDKKVVEVLG